VSRSACYSLIFGLLLFYVAAPIMVHPAENDVRIPTLAFLAAAGLAKLRKSEYTDLFLKMAALYLGLYYVHQLDRGDVLIWDRANLGLFTAISMLIGASYCCYLVATFEKIPVAAMDYLLLAIVVLTFFLPNAYLRNFHIHRIAVEFLLIFAAFELIFFKMRHRPAHLAAGIVLMLAANMLIAL